MKKTIFLLIPLLVLAGCGGPDKSDVKNNFCGVNIDARYCKCAFHNEYCKDLGMSSGEAEDHVYDKYDQWQNPDLNALEAKCNDKNGAFSGQTCFICDQGETVVNNKCVSDDEIEESVEEVIENEDVANTGECKYDSDCPATCEGDMMWKRGCNARTNTCENTFDTNCAVEVESFGDMGIAKICTAGACVRDTASIVQEKAELEQIKKDMSDEVKVINTQREELKNLMLDANKNCINGIADMTNVAILEFATRVGSVMAGGFPDLASASVDYVNDAINKISASADTATPAEKKLKPHEYIKLHCDLYTHFSTLLEATDAELEEALSTAQEADDQLKLLP